MSVKKSFSELTNAELQQLLEYIQTAIDDGWYYGKQADFIKRADNLKSYVVVEMELRKAKASSSDDLEE